MKIFKWVMSWIKSLFCKHDYRHYYGGWFCAKCHKTISNQSFHTI